MSVIEYRKRRADRLKKRMDDDWITIKGTHVLVDDDKNIKAGPEKLKNLPKGNKQKKYSVVDEMKPRRTDYEYDPKASFGSFMRNNAEKMQDIYDEFGREGIEDEWFRLRLNDCTGDFKRITDDEIDEAFDKGINKNTAMAWLVEYNSHVKPGLVMQLTSSKEVHNAALNVMYENYLDQCKSDGTKPLSFEKFLVTPIKMYRGGSGREYRSGAAFSSYTFSKDVAERFKSDPTGHSGKDDDGVIYEAEIRPIDTYGSLNTSGESEIFVPRPIAPNKNFDEEPRMDWCDWEWYDPVKWTFEDLAESKINEPDFSIDEDLLDSIIQDAEMIELFASSKSEKDKEIADKVIERCIDSIQRSVGQMTALHKAQNGDSAFFEGELDSDLGEKEKLYPGGTAVNMDAAWDEWLEEHLEDFESDDEQIKFRDGEWGGFKPKDAEAVEDVDSAWDAYKKKKRVDSFRERRQNRLDARFNEGEHPRGKDGKFISGGASEVFDTSQIKVMGSHDGMGKEDVDRFADMTGASYLRGGSGDKIVLDKSPNGDVYSHFRAEGGSKESQVVFRKDKTIDIEYMFIGDSGKGLGTKVLRNLIDKAKNGYKSITLHAKGNAGGVLNGYYTWARLGFDGNLSEKMKEKARESGLVANRVSDLMQSEVGRKWWKENGEEMDMAFNLADGSLSRRMLDEYVKGKRFDAKEEPAAWITVNGNHIPVNEEGNPVGGQKKALGKTAYAGSSEKRRISQKIDEIVKSDDSSEIKAQRVAGLLSWLPKGSEIEFPDSWTSDDGYKNRGVREEDGKWLVKYGRGKDDHYRLSDDEMAGYMISDDESERPKITKVPDGSTRKKPDDRKYALNPNGEIGGKYTSGFKNSHVSDEEREAFKKEIKDEAFAQRGFDEERSLYGKEANAVGDKVEAEIKRRAKMRKGDKENAPLNDQPQVEDIYDVLRDVRDFGMPKDFEPDVRSDISPERTEAIIKEATERFPTDWFKGCGLTPVINIVDGVGRAHCTNGRFVTVYTKSNYGLDEPVELNDRALVNTLAHELGHYMEASNEKVGASVDDAFYTRARDSEMVEIEPGYMGYKDSFFNTYMGKVYGDGVRVTEVLSVLMENIGAFNPFPIMQGRDYDFSKQRYGRKINDKESLGYILGVLAGL